MMQLLRKVLEVVGGRVGALKVQVIQMVSISMEPEVKLRFVFDFQVHSIFQSIFLDFCQFSCFFPEFSASVGSTLTGSGTAD